MTPGSTSSRRSGRRAAIAAKKAELAMLAEARAKAELDAIEADEACSRILDDARSQLAERLQVAGLCDDRQQNDRQQDDNVSPGAFGPLADLGEVPPKAPQDTHEHKIAEQSFLPASAMLGIPLGTLPTFGPMPTAPPRGREPYFFGVRSQSQTHSDLFAAASTMPTSFKKLATSWFHYGASSVRAPSHTSNTTKSPRPASVPPMVTPFPTSPAALTQRGFLQINQSSLVLLRAAC